MRNKKNLKQQHRITYNIKLFFKLFEFNSFTWQNILCLIKMEIF